MSSPHAHCVRCPHGGRFLPCPTEISFDQFERGQHWDKGKGCDSFGPLGPWLVSKDEVPDPQVLNLWLEVSGQRVQHGSTATMIFGRAAFSQGRRRGAAGR